VGSTKWIAAITVSWGFRARGSEGPIGVVYSRPSVAEPGVPPVATMARRPGNGGFIGQDKAVEMKRHRAGNRR
jgi:hypothetical protein